MTMHLDFARKIAKALGDDWSAEPYYDLKRNAVLTSGRQRLLVDFPGFHSRTHVNVSGLKPEDCPRTTWHIRTTEINVALKRGAVAIAGDIQRRLLPEYRKELEQVDQAIEEFHKEKAAQRRIAEQIANGLPGVEVLDQARDGTDREDLLVCFRAKNTGFSFRVYPYGGTAELRVDRMEIEDPALARAVAETIISLSS